MRLHIGVFVLVFVAASGGAALAEDDAPWWNNDWARRRPVQVKNAAEHIMEEGYTLRIKSDLLSDLIRDKKVKKDLSDVRVVYAGREIPRIIWNVGSGPANDGLNGIWFSAQKALAPGEADTGYWLYYGNPSATPPGFKPEQIMLFFDDFDGDALDTNRWTVDPAVEYTVAHGQLVITDTTRTSKVNLANTEAFTIKGMPPAEGFMFQAKVTYEDDENFKGQFSLWLKANFETALPPWEELDKTIRDLILKLADEDWQTREKATEDILDIGKPAVPYLEQALQDSDAEVAMRAELALDTIRNKPSRRSAAVAILDQWIYYSGAQLALVGSDARYNTGQGTVDSGSTHTLTMLKDASGKMDMQFDDSVILTGTMKKRCSSLAIALGLWEGATFGTMKVDRVVLRKYMNPEPGVAVAGEQTSK
jgi:hypothetical protein